MTEYGQRSFYHVARWAILLFLDMHKRPWPWSRMLSRLVERLDVALYGW